MPEALFAPAFFILSFIAFMVIGSVATHGNLWRKLNKDVPTRHNL